MVTVCWQNQPFSRKIPVREATHQLEVTALLPIQAGEEKEPSGLRDPQVQRLGLAWSTARCRHWAAPRRPLCWAAVSRQVLLLQSACPPAAPNCQAPGPAVLKERERLSWMSTQQFREPWDRSLLDLSGAGVHAWSSLGYMPLFMAMGTLWNMRRSFSKGTVAVVGRKKQMPSTSSSKSWQRPLDMLTKPVTFAHHTG